MSFEIFIAYNFHLIDLQTNINLTLLFNVRKYKVYINRVSIKSHFLRYSFKTATMCAQILRNEKKTIVEMRYNNQC